MRGASQTRAGRRYSPSLTLILNSGSHEHKSATVRSLTISAFTSDVPLGNSMLVE